MARIVGLAFDTRDDVGMPPNVAQHSVHPTGGTLRVFRQFSWLGVGSVKMALSRPTHQRVTQAVGLLVIMKQEK